MGESLKYHSLRGILYAHFHYSKTVISLQLGLSWGLGQEAHKFLIADCHMNSATKRFIGLIYEEVFMSCMANVIM